MYDVQKGRKVKLYTHENIIFYNYISYYVFGISKYLYKYIFFVANFRFFVHVLSIIAFYDFRGTFNICMFLELSFLTGITGILSRRSLRNYRLFFSYSMSGTLTLRFTDHPLKGPLWTMGLTRVTGDHQRSLIVVASTWYLVCNTTFGRESSTEGGREGN